MALPPPLRALGIGEFNAPHSLEMYLDYLCPFSNKQLQGVYEHLLPLIFEPSSPYYGKVRIILRPYPQPWHSSAPILAEAALAIARLAEPSGKNAVEETNNLVDPKLNAFWVFSREVMKNQEAYFDGPSRTKNPDQIRGDFVNLAVATLGEQPKREKGKPLVKSHERGMPLGQAVKNLVRVEPEGNAGSAVAPDLKYCVKIGRQNGIHVTPTMIWNGLVEPSISSSYGEKEWKDFLEKHIGGGQK
ncbi:hypothetical protein FA10DRAFT_272366 [Acaromyces ingoldii]|uniref:Thioredoxin-like fold domain-containing protein n=1 Tax=Acaromyces ingoldii TaxID=215250 RepID=A0A316YI71_9BASI|nr:hypothetical protein FA10DRAFT_272366 [Acaromyces ingoldii]PWN89127.1 hypothetical protein FA10DRAFT_272366 [Acaromyces ingoldii]